MHSKSNNTKFTFDNDGNEVVDELFESLRSRYQANLETSMEEKELIFDSVQLIYYKWHKVNFIGDGSYIDSQDWIKKKKNNNKCEK